MPVKMINMGDSSAGKTCALLALPAAKYHLRVLDLDNGMDSIIDLLTDPKSPYPKHTREYLRWKTLTEPMRVVGGNIQPKSATVWNRAVDMLENWRGDEWINAEGIRELCPLKIGGVGTWEDDCCLAVDTLSTLGTSAKNFYLMMNGKLGQKRSSREEMRDIGAAQEMLDKVFQLTFDASIKCNVIFNAHTLVGQEDGSAIDQDYEGLRYVFPAAIGRAMSIGKTSMARYFNHLLYTRQEGGASRIYTKGLPNVKLKTGAPLKVAASYPNTDGLAKYFEAVNGAKRTTQAPAAAAVPAASTTGGGTTA